MMRLVLASLVVGCLSCSDGGEARVDERPSVIIVSIDTLHRDHVGFHGYERDTTPFLDRLAKESLVFDSAYSTMSWTLIAHMSLLTGLYPSQHRVWSDKSTLPKAVPTLAQRLDDEGYTTLGFYNPGWLNPVFGYDRGFDLYKPHENAEEAEEHVARALDRRKRGRPVFLFLHLFDAHTVPFGESRPLYEPPAPYDELFKKGARESFAGLNGREIFTNEGVDVSDDLHESIVALYDGSIRYVDAKLEVFFAGLQARGLLENSIVIITSDHGEALGQRGTYRGHGDAFEEGLRVPLLIRFPHGRFGGEREAGPVSHVDIVPTVLDLLGLPLEPGYPGYSLLQGRPAESLIVAERPTVSVIYKFPWKLRAPEQGRSYLYDLDRDPREEAPLLGHEADRATSEEIARELKAEMGAERADWATFGPGFQSGEGLSEETLRRLDAIGYGGED